MPGGLSAFNPRERSYTPTGFKETVTPRAMTVAEIEATIAEYRAAPANARRAGFDGVEIHALGSFLIPQFLNPRPNRRTDGYGGDRVARRRLLLEIIDAVAEPWYGKRVGCGWRRIGSLANAVIDTGIADAVSFARHFIANPDLVTRFALGRELATGDTATYYTGGVDGYLDCPVSGW